MFTPSLRWLIGIAIFMVWLSWIADSASPSSWLSSALLSIGTGILTSITLIYAYDNLLAKRNEKERVEREKRAIAAIAPIIRQHYRVLLDCYRSSCDFDVAPSFRDVNEFLGPQYQQVVSHLDIYAPSPFSSSGVVPYYQYIEDSFSALNREINSLLITSGRDLCQDVFLATIRLRDSEFMRIAQSLTALCNTPIPGFGRVPSQCVVGMKESISSYCAVFAQLISALENTHAQGLREYRQSEWHNANFAPGHARQS